MLPNSTIEENQQNSTLVAKRSDPASNRNQRPNLKDGKLWCDHCSKPYHTKETCWDIHGKPTNWKPRSQRRLNNSAHVAETIVEPAKINSSPMLFTPEQIEILKSMMQSPR